MILVDTSVWVQVLRDRTGNAVRKFRKRVSDEPIAFARFTQLELLQGAKDDYEWNRLDEYLTTQYYLESTEDSWREAARIYFELRRSGITLSSPIDACIAQIAIESKALLLHRDEDFERITQIRPLIAERFEI